MAIDPLTSDAMESNNGGRHGGMDEPQPIEPSKDHTPPPASAPAPASASAPASAADTKQQAPPAAEVKDDTPNIVVAIPSMRRWQKDKSPAPEKYLYNLVTGIWNQMNENDKRHVSFLLMNVDKQPEKHEELLQLQGHPAVRILTKHGSGSYTVEPEMSQNGKAKLADGRELSREAFEWVAGETRDAPTLLLEASKAAPYVVFLEDDVTPTSNVMAKIIQNLRDMKNEGKDFLMMDLYTPAISWGPQTAANREKYNFECCTQAMLFDSRHVPALVEYEMTHPSQPVDDNIRDFVRQHPDQAIYAMVPNPFEHVGRFSSNPEKSTGTTEHRSLNFVP
jgi:hypothetical protein